MRRDPQERAAAVAQALADPLRLALLERLLDGPAAVAELVAATGASQPNASNHLALLRERGLVRADRQGRQVTYRLRDGTVAQLIEALAGAARARAARPRAPAPLALARTCYDHLAGRLGVRLLAALVERGALAPASPQQGTPIDPGPNAREVLGGLGVDLAAAARGRRRLALACVDWTERRPHLGGALGKALCDRFVTAGWVLRQPGTRAVLLTAAGREVLRERLGVELEGAPPRGATARALQE